MNQNQRLFQVLELILKLAVLISLGYWFYQIYLTILSFSPAISAPWMIELLYATRFYILFTILMITLYIIAHRLRKKLTTKKIKILNVKLYIKHPIKSSIILLLSLFVIVVIGIIVMQPIILYHPNHSQYAYERLLDIDQYETYEIKKHEYELHGFGKVDKSEKLPTIIYFGGNGESSAQTFYQYHRNDIFEHFDGFQFIMIDYPDYGLSEGKTRDHTILDMGEVVYQYVANLDYVDAQQIYIYGYSIGTGVATYIASTYEVEGLVLIAPYSSIIDLFNSYLPIFNGPLQNLVIENFDSKSYAKDVDVKPLIIASKTDQTIPYELSYQLSEAFDEIYKFYAVNQVAHNEFLTKDDVIEEIINYITQ